MSTANTEIHKAFRNRLLTLTGYRIATENVSFKPETDEVYLREMFVPGEPDALTIDFDEDVTDYKGFYQVSVYAPSGGGKTPTYDACEAIEDLFKRGLRFEEIELNEKPVRARGYKDDKSGRFVTPITIYYRSFR